MLQAGPRAGDDGDRERRMLGPAPEHRLVRGRRDLELRDARRHGAHRGRGGTVGEPCRLPEQLDLRRRLDLPQLGQKAEPAVQTAVVVEAERLHELFPPLAHEPDGRVLRQRRQHVPDMVGDGRDLRAARDRSRRGRRAHLVRPDLGDARVHRLAVHDGIRDQDDLAVERDDHDRLAAVEVVEVRQVADVGRVAGGAEHEHAVEPVAAHERTEPFDPRLVLLLGEREDAPAEPVLVGERDLAPAVGHGERHAPPPPGETSGCLHIPLILCVYRTTVTAPAAAVKATPVRLADAP